MTRSQLTINTPKYNIFLVWLVFTVLTTLFLPLFNVNAEFGFAPPRNPEPQNKSSAIDANASTQLSVINSFEKTISKSVPPLIKSYLYSIDASRQDIAKKFNLMSSKYPDKSGKHYLYVSLEYIFSHGYIAYGMLAAAILFLIRIILLRLNFIV